MKKTNEKRKVDTNARIDGGPGRGGIVPSLPQYMIHITATLTIQGHIIIAALILSVLIQARPIIATQLHSTIIININLCIQIKLIITLTP